MKNMLTMWMKSNSINRCGNGLQVFFNCGIEQDTGYLKIAMVCKFYILPEYFCF